MVGDKVKFYAGVRGYLVGTVIRHYREQGCVWFDVETNQGIFTVPPDQCDYLDI